MAANNIVARTMPVMFGVVSRTLLKRASNRNDMFCSQIFRNARGQRRFNHLGFLSEGVNTAPRWSHSPGRGIGQSAHQPIQTKTMLKFRLPTDVPTSPATIAKR